jgi:hypothetical protein
LLKAICLRIPLQCQEASETKCLATLINPPNSRSTIQQNCFQLTNNNGQIRDIQPTGDKVKGLKKWFICLYNKIIQNLYMGCGASKPPATVPTTVRKHVSQRIPTIIVGEHSETENSAAIVNAQVLLINYSRNQLQPLPM